MNIVLINSIGKNKWGGGEKWMIMAASGLNSIGHNTVIACRKGSVLSARAAKDHIPVVEISARSDFDAWACLRFFRFFNKFRPDAIIGCQNKDWRVASVATKLLGLNTKVYSRQGLQLLKNNWWYKYTIKLLCDGIITNTYSIKNFYDTFLSVPQHFTKVIYNGVEPIPQEIEEFNYQQYIPTGQKKPVIVVSTGRLASQKGFEYLIDAAAEILKTHPHVCFFLAGRGKLLKQLQARINKRRISGNFILLGFLDDIHPLLKSADIYVSSSLYEGMPNSVLEAMLHGLGVVSTNVNGINELITNGHNGWVVEPRNANQLAEAISDLAVDTEKRKLFGTKAAQLIKTEFTAKKMIHQLNDFLKV